MSTKNVKDETGHRYGRLLVQERYPVRGARCVYWKCLCDPQIGGCGAEVVVSGKSLRAGRTRSCGCLRSEVNGAAMTKRWADRKKGAVK